MMAEYQIWEHVKAYTGRNLSHEEDSLNGLLGTLDSFHFLSPPIEQYWGLPVAKSFEESLCWVHGLSVFPIRRSGFPSWSWTGWRGKVEPFDLPSTKQEGHVQFCAGLKDGRHIPFGCHDFTSEVSPHLMMETWQFLGNFAEYPQVGDDYDHKSPEVHNSDWSLVSNLTRLPACVFTDTGTGQQWPVWALFTGVEAYAQRQVVYQQGQEQERTHPDYLMRLNERLAREDNTVSIIYLTSLEPSIGYHGPKSRSIVAMIVSTVDHITWYRERLLVIGSDSRKSATFDKFSKKAVTIHLG